MFTRFSIFGNTETLLTIFIPFCPTVPIQCFTVHVFVSFYYVNLLQAADLKIQKYRLES